MTGRRVGGTVIGGVRSRASFRFSLVCELRADAALAFRQSSACLLAVVPASGSGSQPRR